MPDLIPLQRTALGQFDEKQFSAWALNAHEQQCPTCRTDGDGRCPRGRLLAAATAPTGDPDLPGYGLDTYPAI